MKPADKERLFKMILDHPDFQQYLHPELEDRVPLKVKSNSELGTNLSIEKFGKAIEFVNSINSIEITPILEVISFNIGNNQVSFEILYEIEGVTIKGILESDTTQWSFKEFDVFEN